MTTIADLLGQGLTELAVESTPLQVDQLLAFQRLLAKWNRVYNLTSIDRPEDMVRLHLLDSLAIQSYLRGRRILDVGTGAGLPGIPLAIVNSDREFVLLDSNSKKTRFVTQAAIELGLKNVVVVHSRLEQYLPDQGFDLILCRAFASLADIVTGTRRLLAAGGSILAQKGKLQADEIGLMEGLEFQAHSLKVPGLDAERHLVAITVRG